MVKTDLARHVTWYKSGIKITGITKHFLMDFSYSPQENPYLESFMD